MTPPAQPVSPNCYEPPEAPTAKGGPKLVSSRSNKGKNRTVGKRQNTSGAPPPEPPRIDHTWRIRKLETLLHVEGAIRSAQTLRELIYCLANEPLKLVDDQRIFVLKPKRGMKDRYQIDAVSNLSSVDRNSPTILALEDGFSQAAKSAGLRSDETRHDPLAVRIPVKGDKPDITGTMVPLIDKRGALFSALVFVGDEEKLVADGALLARIGVTACHAWLALQPTRKKGVSRPFRKAIVWGGLALCLLAMAIPVPLSALAPVEVVAKQPQIVAAPIDGVIEEVLVEPNTPVAIGTPLFRYVDTALDSSRVIALQKRIVAEAKVRTARQNSFGQGQGGRDVAIAEAELKLAQAELDFAQAQFSKSIVVADRTGLVIFDSRSEWQGRPVSVGERVLEIADPSLVEARIDLPVGDSIILQRGARVKFFYDANPLTPTDGMVSSAGYRAAMNDEQSLAFRVMADLANDGKALPRIGARGTAQIFGNDVPLGFYLFRRPLSFIRQWTGW